MGKVHVSEFDGKARSLINHYQNIPEAMSNISYEPYHSLNFKEFLTWMDVQQTDGPKFKTWILDSVTSASNTAILYQLWKKDKAVKTSKAGLPVTGFDELNAETVFFTDLLEASNHLNEKFGTNIIWIAHPVSKMEIVKEEGKLDESRRYESISSYGYKVPSLIPTKFDEIYRMYVEKIGPDKYRRLAHTSMFNDGNIVARTSIGLPPIMDVTDGLYSAMIKLLKKKEEDVASVAK